MFLRKRQKQIDKEIINNENLDYVIEKTSTIDLKVNSHEQVFSEFSYDEISPAPEFCDYLYKKANDMPFVDDITIKIHSKEKLKEQTVINAIKNYARSEYIETRKEIKKVNRLSLLMTIFGVLILTLLFTLHYFFDNAYVTTILEIAAWVFIWEAVDFFFLQRPQLKRKCLTLQKIFTASIEITKD